jgi:hypothetical protein
MTKRMQQKNLTYKLDNRKHKDFILLSWYANQWNPAVQEPRAHGEVPTKVLVPSGINYQSRE